MAAHKPPAGVATDYQVNQFQASYIRHFNTLSTGSILLVTIFLEKLFPQPRWKALVAVALIGFLASLIGGVAAYSGLTVFDIYGRRTPRRLGEVSLIITWSSFLVGVAALAVFALKNLF